MSRFADFTNDELCQLADAIDHHDQDAFRERSGLAGEIVQALAERGVEYSLWGEIVPMGRGDLHPETGLRANRT